MSSLPVDLRRPATTSPTFPATSAVEAVTDGAGQVVAWLWPRTMPAGLAAHARSVLFGPWFSVRGDLDVAELDGAVDDLLTESGMSPSSGRSLLAADLVAMGELLAQTAHCTAVHVRLEHEPGGKCPVFHEDNYTMRLLCTYTGPGTEWLRPDQVDRSQLGLQGRSAAQANRAIALGKPHRTRAGEVLIAKGSRFERGAAGLVHRSPKAALGSRLVLAMDPVHATEPA